MLKQTVFALFFGFAFTIQAEEATTKSENINFTKEESALLYDIFGLFGDRTALNNTFYLLGRECGWGIASRPDSYSPHEYPHCQKVLAFMKYYKQQRIKLDRDADNLLYKEILGSGTFK